MGGPRRPLFLLLAGALILSGCMSYRVRSYDTVNAAERTVTIPPGGGLTGAIKEALARDGWKIVVYRGPDITQGVAGDQTRLANVKTFNTRYTLFLRWQQFDTCVFGFDPAYTYDISLVDNATASEVMTLSGRGCEGRIVEKLQEAMSGPKR